MKQIAQKLEAEIAKAVSLIINASQQATVEALNEAFGIAQQRNRKKVVRDRRAVGPRASTSNRTATELKSLEEGFWGAVLESPGESMNALATRIRAKPRQLRVAVVNLKKNGRIKTVGERQFTRYFPIEADNESKVAVD